MIVLATGALVTGGMLVGFACGLLLAGQAPTAVPVAMLAVVAGAIGARQLLRLGRWPASRIGFFRDRMLVVLSQHQVQARWSEIELISLADQSEWGALAWPAVRLTDRLTVRLRGGGSFSFRPASVGLEPIACRDLMLRLRDQPVLRTRLPAFGLAFSKGPPHAGELIRPEL
jgi:hypothetical protein